MQYDVMKQSVILTIHGRVQGVGFRYFVKQQADKYCINGFVRNLPDGNVYIEAEGESEQLNHFIQICKQGPSHAYVKTVEVQYCPSQNFLGFEKR
jgi:acylphosphatase